MRDDNSQQQFEQQQEQEYEALKLKIEKEMEEGKHDSEWADFIMDNCGGDRVIGNGEMLLIAMEEFYLYDQFVEHLIEGVTA